MRALASIALVMCIGGCGAVVDRTDAVRATSDFLDAKDSAWCRISVRCGEIGASEATYCEALAHYYRSRAPSLIVETGAGRIDLDTAAAARCLDLLSKLPCGTMLGDADLGCDYPFIPRVAEGGACAVDRECVEGRCGSAAAPGCESTCQSLGRCPEAHHPDGGGFGIREPCSSDSDCALGTSCLPSTAVTGDNQLLCLSAADVGETCSAEVPCRAGLNCTGPGAPATGTCACPPSSQNPATAPAAIIISGLDEPCVLIGHVMKYCADGLYCAGGAGICEAGIPAGADCFPSQHCASGLVCALLRNDFSNGGTCQPFLDDNAPCDPNEMPEGNATAMGICAADMVCDERVLSCVSGQPATVSCSFACSNGDCIDDCPTGHFCDSNASGGELPDAGFGATEGHCSPLRALGDSCVPPVDEAPNPCFEGRCDLVTATCVLACGK